MKNKTQIQEHLFSQIKFPNLQQINTNSRSAKFQHIINKINILFNNNKLISTEMFYCNYLLHRN
ncbi:hypothetical protein Hanom_Chr12g01128501 [Helianthus anomalus]